MPLSFESKIEKELMDFHHEAMGYTDIGDSFKSLKYPKEDIQEQYQKAFLIEKRVALFFKNKPNFEPTRSIFFLSAASLAINAELWDEAREMIRLGIKFHQCPGEIRDQMVELLKQIPEEKRADDALSRQSTL